MKTRLQAVLIAGAAVLLAACASGGGMASKPPAEPHTMPGQIVTDAGYVAAVERMARLRGVNVQWVNPPTRRVAEAEDGVASR